MNKTIFVILLLILVPGVSLAAVQTLYVSPSGSGSACSEGSPCTLATALTTVSGGDGDIIILNSGTYSGVDINLSDTTNHDNLTITTTPAVIAALGTFTRGIPSGTDNRPYFQGTDANTCGIDIAAGVSNVTISYLRMRFRTNPVQDWAPGVWIDGAAPTISYCEFWNGKTGIGLNTIKNITIRNNYIHDMGVPGYDSHGIAVWNFENDTVASGWNERIWIYQNTIYNCAGDGFQELGESYGSGHPATRYVDLDSNEIYGNSEQGIDFKGTRYVKIHNNLIHDNGFGGIGTNDSDGGVNYQHLYFYIYNNTIYNHSDYAIMSQETDDGYFYIWNNLIYSNGLSPLYNWSVLHNIPPNSKVEHNVLWNNTRSSGNQIAGLYSAFAIHVHNNIFYNNGLSSYGNINSSTPSTNISYNYVYPTSPGITGSNAITSSNPYFVNIASAPYDFHVTASSSPCDNAGTDLSGVTDYTIDTDYSGIARDATPWIGAYETESGGTVPSAISTVTGVTVSGGSIQ